MKKNNNHVKEYFSQVSIIASLIDKSKIESLVKELAKIKKKSGRLFFLGVGGSAGNSSHAVNDFRKLCGIESYAPTDNVSELTARINDEGWSVSFSDWLKVSKLNKDDAIFIFSVGGGNKKKNVSTNLITAIQYAKKVKAKIFGIIGRKDTLLIAMMGCFVFLENKINQKYHLVILILTIMLMSLSHSAFIIYMPYFIFLYILVKNKNGLNFKFYESIIIVFIFTFLFLFIKFFNGSDIQIQKMLTFICV